MVNRSKTFHSVLTYLKTDDSDVDVVNGRQRLFQTYSANELCLRAILRCMGDDTMTAHLHNFLESYPAQ